MTFDATDKKYLKSEEFLPDKESSWKYPPEADGWVHAHNSIRAEMRALIEAVDAVGGSIKAWQVACIKTAWESHFTHIHSHHTNEDDVFVPKIKVRFHYPDKYAADHETLVAKLDKIAAIVKDLKEGDSNKALLTELMEYEVMMKPHLQQEEDECLPLMRAYFTPEDIAPIIQEIIGAGPKIEIGSFIHCMGAETFRNVFMVQEGIPFFVWYIDFKSRLALFEKEFVKPLNAVKAGVEPVAESSMFSYLFMALVGVGAGIIGMSKN